MLWAGADGAEPSARFEALLEGCQEAEARIFMEQALDRSAALTAGRGLLPDDLAERARKVLHEHNRETLHIPVHVSAHQLTEGARGWLARSRRLYRAAAEVGQVVGVDVEETDIAAVVPALDEKTLTLTLRNWTGRPRQWKAAASEPWLRLGESSGTVAGRREVPVTLDGRALRAGGDLKRDAPPLESPPTVTGTVTITDASGAAQRHVRIAARVIQPVDVVTESTIYNIVAGSTGEKTFTVRNRSGREHDWRVSFSAPWLKAQPTGGTLQPGGMTAVRVTAAPPGGEATLRQADLTLVALGGKARCAVPLHVFVIPPYRPPASLPAGTPVPLNTVHKKLVVSHRSMNWFRENVNASATFGRTLSFWGPPKPIIIGEKKYDMALWVLPRHETVYKLDAAEGGGPYKAFSAEVGVNAVVSKHAAGHRDLRVCFEVHVDGRMAAHSGLMKSTDPPKLLLAERLDQAKELKLITRLHTMLYDDNSYRGETAYSNWANPTLYKP